MGGQVLCYKINAINEDKSRFIVMEDEGIQSLISNQLRIARPGGQNREILIQPGSDVFKHVVHITNSLRIEDTLLQIS